MPIIPWRPFWELEKWFEEEWPEPVWPALGLPKIRTPRMDIYETDEKVIAEVELPGVNPENIHLEVKDNVLKVEARVEEKKEVKEGGYYKREMGTRYFKRVVPLPTEVVGEKAEAEYGDGILKITIPKSTPKKTKETKIKIKVRGKNK